MSPSVTPIRAASKNAERARPCAHVRPRRVGPDLPSLGGILIGSVMFVTGGMLLFTIIGIPFGIPLFAAGLGWMLTPKEPTER